MIKFNAKKKTEEIISWIRWYFEKNGNENTPAIVAVSGGTDSSVVLALCKEALGTDRVVAVLLPRGEQEDIRYSYTACTVCGIPEKNIYEINIDELCNTFVDCVSTFTLNVPEKNYNCMYINFPARIRMNVTYAISAIRGGRVANTCNLSEDWVGYATKFGDTAGDFSPLADITKTEVREIGKALGLPDTLVYKTPTDGLCGKTDEDNLGFTYATLDNYIRTKECSDEQIKNKIDTLHYANLHKLKPMPKFHYRPDRIKAAIERRKVNESTPSAEPEHEEG